MNKRIVTEKEIEKMQELKKRGLSCRQSAQMLNLSKSTVSIYTKAGYCAGKRETDVWMQTLRQATAGRQRHDALYDVQIYAIRKKPQLVIVERLDHRPTYTDMMRICLENGLKAVDFEDDRGTKIDDYIYHGNVYMSQSHNAPLARFTIQRLKGEVYIEDFFR